MVNTNKPGYSTADLAQILGCTTNTIIRMVDAHELEAHVDAAKSDGGRRKIRFSKEHIQHYLVKHIDRFDDATLRAWGVLVTPKKYTANASTPRIPIDAFSKELEGTPTKPDNPNMRPTTAAEWASPKEPRKPYIRTPEIKAAEQAAKEKAPERTPYSSERTVKKFPGFKITIDGYDILDGIEPTTAGAIVAAIMNDRNIRVSELSIRYSGSVDKEVPKR